MGQGVGVWIDHKKAIIVSITAGEVTTRVPTKMGGPGAPDDLEEGHLTQSWPCGERRFGADGQWPILASPQTADARQRRF